MNKFTQTEQNYLEIIGSLLKKVVKENNIPQEYFEKHFMELFTMAHNYYQDFLKRAMTDEELKIKIGLEMWKKLSAVA